MAMLRLVSRFTVSSSSTLGRSQAQLSVPAGPRFAAKISPEKFTQKQHLFRTFRGFATEVAKAGKDKKSDAKAGDQGGAKKRGSSAEERAKREAEEAAEKPEADAEMAKYLAEEEGEDAEELEERPADDVASAMGSERRAIVERDIAFQRAIAEHSLASMEPAERRRWEDAQRLDSFRPNKQSPPELKTAFEEAFINAAASPHVDLAAIDEMTQQEDADMVAELAALPPNPRKLVIDPETEMREGHFFRIYDEELDYVLPEGFMGKQLEEQSKLLQNWSLLVRPAVVQCATRLQAQRDANFKTARDRRASTLTGRAGVGKSAVLTQVVYWARRTGWLVCAIDAEKFVSEGNLQRSRLEPTCFDQPEVAMEFLRCQSVAHPDKLSQIPLKTPFTLQGFKRSSGSTLLDLVRFGAEEANFRYAADALCYFRRELNLVTEFPVLIAIDSINSMYTPSLGFGDPDDRSLRPRLISPEKLTAARCFRDFRNHGLLYGTVVCATSETMPATMKHLRREVPRMPQPIEVPAYDMSEFLTTMRFYRENILFGPLTKGTKKYIYYLCSGRGHEVWKYSLML